jgi:hypothetical protein
LIEAERGEATTFHKLTVALLYINLKMRKIKTFSIARFRYPFHRRHLKKFFVHLLKPNEAS